MNSTKLRHGINRKPLHAIPGAVFNEVYASLTADITTPVKKNIDSDGTCILNEKRPYTIFICFIDF